MEQIKITDKLTLRQEALRMALHSVYRENDPDILKNIVIKRAVEIAEYIQGNAELPEYSDPEKHFRELMAKMQENFKPKHMWNSMPRYDDGTILAPWIDKLRQSIPFCMHDAKCNNTVFVADESEFEHFANEIMKNPRYVAYCPIEVPKYEPVNVIGTL